MRFATYVGAIFTCAISFSPLHLAAAPFDEIEPSAQPTPATDLPSTEPQPPPERVRVLPPEDALGAADAGQAALRAFQAGDEEKCLSLLRDSVAIDPQQGPPELTLAALHFQKGNRARVLQLLEKVAAEETSHPLLHLTYAQLALADGRLTEALMHYDKLAADGPPESWEEQDKQDLEVAILAGKASVAEARGNWDEAQKILGAWLQIHADSPALRHRWARALLGARKESKAFEQYDIAYRQDNTFNRPEAAVGAEYTARGEFVKANKWFATALKKYPDDSSVHYAWAMSLLYQDRADETAEHVRLAGAQGFETNKLDMLRGLVARTHGQPKEAAKHFSQVLKRSPNDREASYQLVLALAAQGDGEQQQRALELANSLTTAHPQSTTALAALGIAQQAAGKRAEALKSLAAAAQRPDARPEALLALGRLLTANNQQSEAQKIASRLREQMASPSVFVERQAADDWLAGFAKAD